jgi:hypothetical protein
MPMDDRTKALVRALLRRHPRGYVADEAGFTVTDTAAGLFRLLCLAVLARDSAPSGAAISAAQALFGKGWTSAQELAKADERELAAAIGGAGYGGARKAAGRLGEAARIVLDRYDGDLQRLREAAGGDPARLYELLGEIPGMDDAGRAVFRREAQMFWPEAGPFIDDRAVRAAGRLGLPADPARLADMACGTREETLSWLAGALALVDARDEYDEVRRDAHA